MYRVSKGPSALLLLVCLALTSWSSVADGDVLFDATGNRPALQELKPAVTATKRSTAGFSPYPDFIDGQSPKQPVEQQQHSPGHCSEQPQTEAVSAQPPQAVQGPGASPTTYTTAQQPVQRHMQELPVRHDAAPVTQQPAGAVQQAPPQQTAANVPADTPSPVQTAPLTSATPVAAHQQDSPATRPTPMQEQQPITPPAAAIATPAAAEQQRQPVPPHPVRRLLNLALLSDGASVVAANPEAKRPERAIDKDIDSFMKNDCNAEKWIIIELSQLGTVETVKLTMKELYSSRVHTFRVLGRSSHPRKDGPDLTASIKSEAWQLLGKFTAENKRGTQSFSLPQRSRVRYILLMFDTHYGNEVMCALNMIEVLGVSAAQELEEALALQEELEAEELFQHLQQQHEQEEEQQLQAQQQLEQQQQPSGSSIVQSIPVGNESTAVAGDTQAAAATQQQQQLQRVIAVNPAPEGQQQQQAAQAAVDKLASGSDVQAAQGVAAATNDQQAKGVARTTDQPLSSSSSSSVGEQLPQQPWTPDSSQVAAKDQDIIAVPDVVSNCQPAEQQSAAGGSGLAAAAASVTNAGVPASSAQPPSATSGSPTVGKLPTAVDAAHQQQKQPPPPEQTAAIAASGRLAGVPAVQTGVQQPCAVAGQPASSTSDGKQTAVPAPGNGMKPEAAVDGHVPTESIQLAAGARVPATGQPALGLQPPGAQQQVTPPNQQQPAVAPVQTPAPVKQPQPSREPVLSGGTAKPKQAGNLFDIIKSEMMQLKLEQGKVSKKLEGLSRRGNEYGTLAAQLQESQTQVLSQLETLASKVDLLADQVARVEIQQYNTQHYQHDYAGAHSSHPAGGMPHAHRPHPHAHSMHTPAGTSQAGHGGLPVCESMVAIPLSKPQYQWGVVAVLAGSAMLGLLVVALHPRGPKMSAGLRIAICTLAVVNALLSVLLAVYLLVLDSAIRSRHYAFEAPYIFDGLVSVPQHRMIGSASV